MIIAVVVLALVSAVTASSVSRHCLSAPAGDHTIKLLNYKPSYAVSTCR